MKSQIMARASFLAVLVIAAASENASAQLWSEYWQQGSFRSTNYADVAPKEVRDFWMLTTAIRGGYRIYFDKDPVKVGFDGYLRLENVHDFAKAKLLHYNVFNNNYKLGMGVKLRFERQSPQSHWFQYFQADLFSEYQQMDTFVDEVRYWFDSIEQENWRSGINSWFNSGNQFPWRYESYFDFSFHTTNFSDKGNNSYLILTLSPRFFYNFGVLDIYINEEVVVDFLNKPWNRNPYSNNLKSIVGTRLNFPFSNVLESNPGHLLYHASIQLFAEYSKIHYLDDVSEWSFQADIADHDIRVGFIVYWPLGESTFRPGGHFGF